MSARQKRTAHTTLSCMPHVRARYTVKIQRNNNNSNGNRFCCWLFAVRCCWILSLPISDNCAACAARWLADSGLGSVIWIFFLYNKMFKCRVRLRYCGANERYRTPTNQCRHQRLHINICICNVAHMGRALAPRFFQKKNTIVIVSCVSCEHLQRRQCFLPALCPIAPSIISI